MSIIATKSEAHDAKTEELLLYVAGKLQGKTTYGSVVLNKLLYFIDGTFYLKKGKPISSFTYVKQEHGHTPRPKEFMSLCEKLMNEGKLEIQKVEQFGKVHKKYMATKPASVVNFTAEEVQEIDKVIEDFGDYNAAQIERISHKELSWIVAGDFEELPFFTYLLTKAEIEEDDLIWANKQISSHRAMRNN